MKTQSWAREQDREAGRPFDQPQHFHWLPRAVNLYRTTGPLWTTKKPPRILTAEITPRQRGGQTRRNRPRESKIGQIPDF